MLCLCHVLQHNRVTMIHEWSRQDFLEGETSYFPDVERPRLHDLLPRTNVLYQSLGLRPALHRHRLPSELLEERLFVYPTF